MKQPRCDICDPADPQAADEGCPIADLRAYLAGDWRLTRGFADRRLWRPGGMIGAAVFAASADGLAYRETGNLRFGSYRGQATQAYGYGFPDAQRAAVRFADGRPFYDLDLSRGACAIRHRCGADLYTGIAIVRTADLWELRWHVAGPAKDLLIATRYRRTKT